MKSFWKITFGLVVFSLTIVNGQTDVSPTRIFSENLLNSPALESNIALTADRQTIYFSSNRGGQKWNDGDSDIYYAIRVAIRVDSFGAWSPAIPIPLKQRINDELNQDEVYISPDGQTLTFQRWSNDWAMDLGPYYQIVRVGNTQWDNSQPLGGGITDFFVNNPNWATDGMTRLPDGSIIFAAGPDFNQPMDLYYSKFDGPAGFLLPQSLSCNTPHDERSAFLSADGQSLYFASDRPGGKGKLDIYRMVFREDGSIEQPENIGEPINTAANECGFVIYSASEGYFIRNGDIYRIENPNLKLAPVRPIEITPEPDFSAEAPPPPCGTQNPDLRPSPQEEPDSQKIKRDTPPKKWSDVPKPDDNTKPGPPPFAPEPPYQPNNIVFLLDVSNSMGEGDKHPLMVSAIRRALPEFYRRDKISVITCATIPDIKLNGVAGDQRKTINLTLTGLKTGGGTDGKLALEEALRCAKDHYITDGQNIVVWATDAKVKMSQLKSIARDLKRKKIELVILLYGTPAPQREEEVMELTTIAEGQYRWIKADNIDAALEDFLQLAVRKQ